MTKELLLELADLRLQEREVKAKIDSIYPQLVEEATELEDGTVIETEKGNFTVSFRRTWTYPQELEDQESELKKHKKLAEQTGEAEYTSKASLVYKSN